MKVKELLAVNPQHWYSKRLTAVGRFELDGRIAEIEYDIKDKRNDWILDAEYKSFADDLEEAVIYLK